MRKKHPLPHRYLRSRTVLGKTVWRCNLPGCTHYIHDGFIEGLESLCAGCGDKFVIQGNEKYKRTPLCVECREKRKKIAPEKIIPSASVDKLLELLGPKK